MRQKRARVRARDGGKTEVGESDLRARKGKGVRERGWGKSNSP
jgi:hypothetical protein